MVDSFCCVSVAMATASKDFFKKSAKNYWKFPIFEHLYILKHITFNLKNLVWAYMDQFQSTDKKINQIC